MIGRKSGFLAVVLATASLGFSQSTGSGSNQNANASANNTATAIAGGNGGSSQAYAGVAGTPGPFPGFPLSNGEWVSTPYFNGMFRQVSMEMMESGRGHDKVHCRSLLKKEDLPAENSQPITLLSWSPLGDVFYLNDRELGSCDVQGKAFEPPEDALLAGLYEAKKEFHSNRCVAYVRQLNQGVTKGFSVGTGSTGGAIVGPGTNNSNVAFAGGGLLGINKVYRTDYPEFRIICLNDGPVQAPEPPKPPEVEEAPATTSPLPPPTPPVAAARPTPPEVKEAPATTSPLPPPTPPVAAARPIDSCLLPEFVVYFDFAKSDMRSEYLPEIEKMAAWLKDHPDCKVVVEGHTDMSGGYPLNNNLGGERSLNVYERLLEDGVPKQQIRHSSFGKYEAVHEHYQPDRKVVLHIEDASSDPNAPINPAK